MRAMNEHLVRLSSFWSAFFLSSQGDAIVRPGMRGKLIELLDALPPTFEGVSELRQHAASLSEDTMIGVNLPLNQEMLAFMLKHEGEIPEEFLSNVYNIKSFFNSRLR
jgi:hypothetical protein